MTEPIDRIYNEHVADEALKSGTKYERLTAIVFKALNQSDTVIHDMRLRGDGKEAEHQIDVTIERGGTKKRILIECKDYEENVGIEKIRNFFGAVHQIKPDEAYVVSTTGFTSEAIKFARDENIKLLLLREATAEDNQNRLRQIHLVGQALYIDTPEISWEVVPEDKEKYERCQKWKEKELADANADYFYKEDGSFAGSFRDILHPIINTLDRKPGFIEGRHTFTEKLYLKCGEDFLHVGGFRYRVPCYEETHETIIGAGNNVAKLILESLDGEIDRAFYDGQIEYWYFDEDGKVVPKSTKP